MKVSVLSSSSWGNCTAIKSGKEAILIDMGLDLNKLKSQLKLKGLRPSQIRGIFVTHSHSDHFKVPDVLSLAENYRIPLYIYNDENAKYEAKIGHAEFARLKRKDLIKELLLSDVKLNKRDAKGRPRLLPSASEAAKRIGRLRIRAFEVPHRDTDLTWITNVCYYMWEELQDKKRSKPLLILTDASYIYLRYVWGLLPRCKCIVIEANHDIGSLMGSDRADFLKRRITLSHLSNYETAMALVRACFESAQRYRRNRIERVLIYHVSWSRNGEKGCNTEKKIKTSVLLKLKQAGFSPPIKVELTHWDKPTPNDSKWISI